MLQLALSWLTSLTKVDRFIGEWFVDDKGKSSLASQSLCKYTEKKEDRWTKVNFTTKVISKY